MKAEPQTTSSWFEDDGLLENEIRHSVDRRAPAPRIPGYEDLREIGQGGQGVVYAATQTGTHRKVAVKVMRDRIAAAPEARRRFEREIDLAAGLRHPHIVAVFDGGTTSEGSPYLVMEFVEGESIDGCAAAHDVRAEPSRRNLEKLVRLFATICDAIQHAHQRGVIHRDLKPGNIRIDSDGVARVLDFGLAKVLGPPRPGLTQTEAGSARFIGSLPWASPEQAAGRVDAIDVRSDVYSLGVTLYQLITGHFPYDVSGDLNAALQNIVTSAPEPPGHYVRTLDADLVTIVLRALAKEPDRRYQAAGELALDLRAWLAHEPIAARRDSLWYLVRITARRRRGPVIAAAVFLLALAASAVVSFTLWRSSEQSRAEAVSSAALANRETEIANRQTDIAIRETAAAKKATESATEAGKAARDAAGVKQKALDLLLDSIFAVDPDVEGRDARILDGLERATSRVDSAFERDPVIRGWLHERFARLFDRLGQPVRAAEEATKSFDLQKTLHGGDDQATLLARAQAAFLAHKAGRSAEAAAELREVLDEQKSALGADAIDTLGTQDFLARALIATGKFKDAEALAVEALAIANEKLSPAAPKTIELMEVLSHARRLLGDLDSAEAIQRDAWERRSEAFGADQFETLNSLSNLVVVLTEHGKLAEAEPLQKRLYERALQKLGPEHTSTLTAANTYAKILQDLGRFDDAGTIFQAAYDARTRVLGPEHKDTLISLANLAALRSYQKDFAKAEALHRIALAARIKLLGPTHLETLISHNNLGGTLREQGRLEEARQEYEKAAQGALSTLGHDHWITAVFHTNLASTLTALGRYSEAEAMLLDAQKVIDAKLGPEHSHAKGTRRYLAALRAAESRAAATRPRPDSRGG